MGGANGTSSCAYSVAFPVVECAVEVLWKPTYNIVSCSWDLPRRTQEINEPSILAVSRLVTCTLRALASAASEPSSSMRSRINKSIFCIANGVASNPSSVLADSMNDETLTYGEPRSILRLVRLFKEKFILWTTETIEVAQSGGIDDGSIMSATKDLK